MSDNVVVVDGVELIPGVCNQCGRSYWAFAGSGLLCHPCRLKHANRLDRDVAELRRGLQDPRWAVALRCARTP